MIKPNNRIKAAIIETNDIVTLSSNLKTLSNLRFWQSSGLKGKGLNSGSD